ncbi:MAG: alpha/beta hydrolase [Puia sp.]|nr:alpha/beta hydrolase [Puia sp.]
MNKYLKHLPITLSFYVALSFYGCTSYGDNKTTGSFFNSRGMKMYYEVYGSGQPLLLIHGNGGSISTFKNLIPFYALKYKVIVADGRSQGRSSDIHDSLSFEMMADDYDALLDHLQIDSADVIGWSDGGIVALLMAMRHPRKTKKIVASGPNLWPDSTAVRPDEWLAEVKEFDSLKNTPKTTDQEKEKWKLLLLDLRQPDISPGSLKNIKCPAMIIGGDHDLIRTRHLELISKNIPLANLWIVPHCGHATLFEHKYKFLYNTDKFLTGNFRKDRVF